MTKPGSNGQQTLDAGVTSRTLHREKCAARLGRQMSTPTPDPMRTVFQPASGRRIWRPFETIPGGRVATVNAFGTIPGRLNTRPREIS